jgi:uncharacterized cupredoxin-like copper-binding protein
MTRIFRAPVLVLMALVACAGLLLMAACGGATTGTDAATQVSSPTASGVAVHQATSAPAAVTAAPTAAPTDTPVPATAAPATPAPAPTDAPPQFTAPVDVSVTLAEFNIQSSLAVFHVGVPYHFIITNNGKIDHELNVANIDARPVTPGATVTLDITFPSQAQAEFACHLPSHYQAGMKLPVTVEP